VSRLESDYYAHMGFDPEHSREVLSFYVPKLLEHGPVLELACGRGELLGLLAKAGVEAVGVDLDEGMAELAAHDGHQVVVGDAVEYLHQDPAPGPFGAVFSAHFLEHLTPEQVMRVADGARRVLRPGGRFVAVTPNPACFAVLSHDFWRDPTHVRFYDIALLEFFCRQAGMEVEESGGNPANHPGPPPAFNAPEVPVHPDFRAALSQVALDASAALRHGPRPLPRRFGHNAQWAQELVHLVGVVADRLAATQQALYDLRRAHQALVDTMYDSNEIYVVARA
jgi:SAM-dependent methyltransferase